MKLKKLWQGGDLFHVAARFPRKRNAPRVDRLAGILRQGLVAPAESHDGSICSDLTIVATGCRVPYDSLVFLHRYGSRSAIYTIRAPGRFAVLVDPALAVLTPQAMGPNWVVLCQDEVYVRDCIPLDKLIGVVVHQADADAVLREFTVEFQRLEMPLYAHDGSVLWPATSLPLT